MQSDDNIIESQSQTFDQVDNESNGKPTPFDPITFVSSIGGYPTIVPMGETEDGKARGVFIRRLIIYNREKTILDISITMQDLAFLANSITTLLREDIEFSCALESLQIVTGKESLDKLSEYVGDIVKNSAPLKEGYSKLNFNIIDNEEDLE